MDTRRKPAGRSNGRELATARKRSLRLPPKAPARPHEYARDSPSPSFGGPQLTTASSLRLWLNAVSSSLKQSLFPPLKNGPREHDMGLAGALSERVKNLSLGLLVAAVVAAAASNSSSSPPAS